MLVELADALMVALSVAIVVAAVEAASAATELDQHWPLLAAPAEPL